MLPLKTRVIRYQKEYFIEAAELVIGDIVKVVGRVIFFALESIF